MGVLAVHAPSRSTVGATIARDAKDLVRQYMVTLDDQHVYRQSAAIVPSVTGTLHRVGIINAEYFTEESCERGTAVHALAWETTLGYLDVSHWPERYRSYGESLQRFLDLNRPETLEHELLVYQPSLNYAGTLDWFCVMSNTLWVIDVKSGRPAKWHPYQTAAYVAALKYLESAAKVTIGRGSLYLHQDGTLGSLKVHYKPGDLTVWQAALIVAEAS